MIWLYLTAWIGFLAVNTSMAEMASMYCDSSRRRVFSLADTVTCSGLQHLEVNTTGK